MAAMAQGGSIHYWKPWPRASRGASFTRLGGPFDRLSGEAGHLVDGDRGAAGDVDNPATDVDHGAAPGS